MNKLCLIGWKGASIMRKSRIVALILVVLLCFAAVSSLAETYDFTFLSTWNETEDKVKLLEELTEKYKAEVNPDFNFNLSVIASDDLQRQVKIYIASNEMPQMFVYYCGRPLQELIGADVVVNIAETPIIDYLDPSAVSLLGLLEGDHASKGLFELPLGMNVEGFWYNKEMFSKYNLEAPETWEDLLNVCQVLKDNGEIPIGMGGSSKWTLTRLIHAYAIRKLGSDCMYRAANGVLSFQDAGFVEAAQAVQDLAQKGYFGDGYLTLANGDAEDMLISGMCGMIYDGSWLTSKLNDETKNLLGENVGFFNVPSVANGAEDQKAMPMNCGSTITFAVSKWDKTVEEWADYVFSRMGNTAMAEFGTLMGYKVSEMPENTPYYTQMVAELVSNAETSALWWETFMDDATTGIAKDYAQGLVLGEISAEEYCKLVDESNTAYLNQ